MENQTAALPNVLARSANLLKNLLVDMGKFHWTPEQIQKTGRPKIRRQLFLTSFLILFFELACIRYIPAHVRYLSFFMNFVLLAVFLGIGIGILMGKRPRLWLPPFPILWFVLLFLVTIFRFQLQIPSTEVLYFGAYETMSGAENFLVLPLMFALVAITITPLGRSLGGLLTGLPPLEAYAVDILGSLAGIAAFFVMSYFSLQPVIWFLVVIALYLLLSPPKELLITLPFIVGALYTVIWLDKDSTWSPYYLVRVSPNDSGGYVISVNNIGHQDVKADLNKREVFYFSVYDLFAPRKFSRVLVIGAGSGSDVGIALAEGAQHVDAVEIDPAIQKFGVQLNPQKPYDDPRVRAYIDDGRAFLRNAPGPYDLIVFALPDSLTLTSGFASIRLESFLMTVEAMQAARRLLAEDGVLVLYNYYREDWLIQKLAYMLQTAFGEPPYVITYGAFGKAAVLVSAEGLTGLNPSLNVPFSTEVSHTPRGRGYPLPVLGEGLLQAQTNQELGRDDWPFVYLPHRTMPLLYLAAILMALVVSVALLGLAQPRKAFLRLDWHFFFLGVAFMLLETRSLVTFALLFGTTWMVNSLVFFAILSSVMLAILVNYKFKLRNLPLLYGLLVASLLLNFFLPLQTLLEFENPVLRYVLASLLAFAPIFLANLVFSRAFRDTGSADIAFGSNLLGAMAGGLLEYLSLLTGYQALLLVAMTAYLLAYFFARRGSPQPAA